jgi:hypothetical protein
MSHPWSIETCINHECVDCKHEDENNDDICMHCLTCSICNYEPMEEIVDELEKATTQNS